MLVYYHLYVATPVTKKRRGKERVKWGRGFWRAVLAFLPRGPEFQVTPLDTIRTEAPKGQRESFFS